VYLKCCKKFSLLRMIITITILLFSHIHVRHIEPNWTCSWARFTLVANRNGNAFTFHWTTYDTKCIEHEVYELFSRQWLSVYSLDRNSICFFVYGRISLYVCLHVLTPNSVRWNSNNSNTVYVIKPTYFSHGTDWPGHIPKNVWWVGTAGFYSQPITCTNTLVS